MKWNYIALRSNWIGPRFIIELEEQRLALAPASTNILRPKVLGGEKSLAVPRDHLRQKLINRFKKKELADLIETKWNRKGPGS